MKQIYLLLTLLLFSACEREAFNYNKNQESDIVDDSMLPDVTVSLATLKLALNSQPNSRSTPAELSNYLVRIHNSVTKDTLSWSYQELPDLITLKPREYSIEACSHIPADVAWETPYYYAAKNFTVEANKVTDLGELTCRLSSILVSVELDEKLCEYIQPDATVVIRVGKGKLTYQFGEERVGSFMPMEELNTLTAELYATTLTGELLEVSGKSFLNVQAGEHRMVKFVLNETETKPEEGQGAPADITLAIDTTCERVDVDVTVNPGDETILPEGPQEPENPDPNNDVPTIDGVGFDMTNSILVPSEGMEIKVDIASKVGFTHLYVTIDSETLTEDILTDVGLAKTFDLAYPGQLEGGLQGLGFPTGDGVIGQTAITFDITAFTPLLGIYGAATHRFIIKAVDANGETTKTLTLISQ